MSGVTRFGVSLEEPLLQQFDRLIHRKGYSNRSEALRDLIRESLVREQWDLGTAETVGTLTLVYNHEVRELAFNRSPTNKIRKAAIAGGMKTLLQDGRIKVLNGTTTAEEIVKVAQVEGIVTD